MNLVPETQTQAQTRTRNHTQTQAQTQTCGPDTDTDPDPDTDPDADPDTDPDTGPDTDTDPDPGTDTDPDPDTDPERDPVSLVTGSNFSYEVPGSNTFFCGPPKMAYNHPPGGENSLITPWGHVCFVQNPDFWGGLHPKMTPKIRSPYK